MLFLNFLASIGCLKLCFYLNPLFIKITDDSEDAKASSVSSVVGILFLVAMLVGCSGWLFYAYRNPHTPSGQCFIRVITPFVIQLFAELC